ncbi:hypothetical protein V5D56_02230 [Cellulosimicrobium sp. PMB13]|uniref:hypothetical protein n=1 Tax=Cellulosimicrobium sp. PMB13 TaxID=3120158 RepID=UPI003F4BB8FB
MTDARPLGAARLVLRPLGYLTIGLVWTTIALVPLALYLSPVVVAVFAPVQPLAEMLRQDPDPVIGTLIVSPVAMVLAGPVFWYVSCATWPLAALSFVYAGRSLRPSFRAEPLSFTDYAAPGTTLGPPTSGSVALSLQPVRASRLTTTLMRFYACGWQPLFREFGPAFPAGVGWALLSVVIIPLLPTAPRAVLAVVALALYAWSVVLLRRRWVWRFHRERARAGRREREVVDGESGAVLRDGPRVVRSSPQSAAHREQVEAERAAARQETEPLTALTSDAIGERRERALRARERRLREEDAQQG